MLCLALAASVRAETPPEIQDEGKALDLCPHADAAWRRALTETMLPAVREADAATDVQHYLLDIELIVEDMAPTSPVVRVEGASTIDVTSALAGLTEFTVDLHSSLTVTGVSGDVSGWSRVGDTVVITLDQPYNAGEQFQVAVAYSGYPTSAGFGAFKTWKMNGNLVVGTLSEPYYARNWWPCKDALLDKSTLLMQVTVPAGLVVASNGNDLGSVPVSGGRTQFTWQVTYPIIPYLVSLAVSNYERYDLVFPYELGGSPATMPVNCYLYPHHWDFNAGQPAAAYKAGCDELLTMLTEFSSAYGLYPFIAEKYGVAEQGGFGGFSANMEHQTITSMVQINDYTDIMAHELAHHWWGDMITCATWYDIWLNEGFATYSEALFREQMPGGGADAYWTRINARRPSSPSAQVYRTNISSVSAIFSGNDVYHKGAWVLHMLRGTIGDEAFYAALADYRAARAYGSATTSEFAAILSSSFGSDLTWFIDQWVMNPGSPRYEWNYATSVIDGQTWLKLRIVQTQSSQGYGLISMPLRIRVTTGAGVETHTVWNDGWTEYYVMPIAAAPTNVEFDEDGGVSSRNWVLFQSATKVATAVSAPPVLLAIDWTPYSGGPAESQLVLHFSEDIGSFSATDFTMTGAASGPQSAGAVLYDAPSRSATVIFNDLPLDSYSFTISAAGVIANAKQLDGEITADTWHDTAQFPSGDGQPGGDAVLALSRRPCDADADGDVDSADAAACIDCLTGPQNGPVDSACHACDADQDDDVDLRDAATLQGAIGQ